MENLLDTKARFYPANRIFMDFENEQAVLVFHIYLTNDYFLETANFSMSIVNLLIYAGGGNRTRDHPLSLHFYSSILATKSTLYLQCLISPMSYISYI